MATYLIQKATLDDIGDAIRAKTGGSALIAPEDMPAAIGGIVTGDVINHADIPAYVKAEVDSVVQKVNAVKMNDSVIFIAGSDSHQSTTPHVAEGNLHAGMAMKALAYALSLDFAAYLGDYTAGSSTTTIAEGKDHIDTINTDINEAFRGLPNFRTVGNHDPLGYSYNQNGEALTPAYLYSKIGKYNEESGDTMGSTTFGVCYRDFPSKKLRVICLNTAEASSATYGSGSAEYVSDDQKEWLALCLMDVGTKSGGGWGVLILSHHPLDWGNIMAVSNIIYAYLDGTIITIKGNSYNFSGKNNVAYLLNVHGHTHCYKVDDLHWNNAGTGEAYHAKRMAVPNMCFVRNNEYGNNTGPEYYGIEFGETTTYNKTADSGKDTAFCVFVLNPSNLQLHAICYGAGYDRSVSLDYTVITHSITANVTNVTFIGDNLAEDGTAYTATVTPYSGYVIDTVTVKMGGVDITSTAYNNGTISIPHVTGNVVITAVASIILPYTNLVPTSVDSSGSTYNETGYKQGYRLNSSGGETASTGSIVCGFIPYDGEVIRAAYFGGSSALSWAGNYICFYNVNKEFIRAVPGNSSGSSLENKIWTYDPDDETNATIKADVLSAKFIRVSLSQNDQSKTFTVTLDENI